MSRETEPLWEFLLFRSFPCALFIWSCGAAIVYVSLYWLGYI